MKLVGAHVILYSKNADADRAFMKDVLGLPHVDVGGGWLIFGLPPAEVALHPTDEAEHHAMFLMVDDIEGFAKAMAAKGVACSARRPQDWGVLAEVTLPGGSKLGVYEPRHARPPTAGAKPRAAKAAKPKKKTPAPRKAAPRKRPAGKRRK